MATTTHARDRQLPAIQWAIVGAGTAAGLLTVAVSMMVMLGESAGQNTTGWWSPYLTAPAAAAALLGAVVFVVASISRSATVRARCMWVAVGADVVASLWIGVDGVWAASADLDVYGAIRLAGALAAAAVLTVPVIGAVRKDNEHAREKAEDDAELAVFLSDED